MREHDDGFGESVAHRKPLAEVTLSSIDAAPAGLGDAHERTRRNPTEVENFRKLRERLAAGREARINKINQHILQMLEEMHAHHPKPTSFSPGKVHRPGS